MTVPPWLTEVQSEARLKLWVTEVRIAAEAAAEWSDAGLTVRTVRGAKMRSISALMDEVSAVLQFPHYFGENWAALGECLADMEWLLPTKGIVLVVLEAGQVLADEHDEQLEAFVEALCDASDEYGKPIELGEAWDRPAVPFHVVLQVPSVAASDAAQRWASAGAQLIE